jgi:hypothetical protein
VRPGNKMAMKYFSCSGWPSAVYIKTVPGHVMPKLVLLHLVGYLGHIVHSICLVHKMLTHYFSCSAGTRAVSIKIMKGHV